MLRLFRFQYPTSVYTIELYFCSQTSRKKGKCAQAVTPFHAHPAPAIKKKIQVLLFFKCKLSTKKNIYGQLLK